MKIFIIDWFVLEPKAMSKNEYLTFYFQRSGTGNDCDDGFSYGKLFAGGGAVKPRFFQPYILVIQM